MKDGSGNDRVRATAHLGSAVTVPGNGTYTLPGFAGSAISSLTVKVEHYAELVALLKSGYHGRIVDILDIGM